VLVAIDDAGPAVETERKVEVSRRGYELATAQAGFAAHEVILDPVILAAGTGLPEHAGTAVATIEACRALRTAFPRTPISGGLSNLSFAFRGNQAVRDALHAVFLQHAIPAGMTMGIVNVARWRAYDNLEPELREAAEDVVLNRREDAPIRLARLARRLRNAARGDGPAAGRPSA
jgi:5-methyltetrahydrofolate--homocysteine methyltransferase